MSNPRKQYSDAQTIALLSQVNRVCPLCAEPLFYKKNGISFKNYELAHIYPLNPNSGEEILLQNEKRLGNDVNDEQNIIPLCEICHGKFDKPRTVEEYRELLNIKQQLINRSGQEAIWKTYSIEEEISEIIEAIYNSPEFEIETEIEFVPREVDEKLNETITRPTKIKIKNNVREYFIFIKKKFAELDNAKIDLSEIISLQVKTYYLKQKNMGLTQQDIFDNIVTWIHMKTKPVTMDAAEILASFFIQNCEVF